MKHKRDDHTHSNASKKIMGLVIVLLLIMALSISATRGRAEGPFCEVDTSKRLSIDVTNVKPQVVFNRLAREPGCAITTSPFIRKRVTVHVENALVTQLLAAVCQQAGCKYSLNGKRLIIQPVTILDKIRARQQDEFNRLMVERASKLQVRLPEGMSFEGVAYSTVLEELSKASGLELKPWKDEGDRKVTLDVSGMTINNALRATVRNVHGEGAVWIKSSYSFPRLYNQYWIRSYPK